MKKSLSFKVFFVFLILISSFSLLFIGSFTAPNVSYAASIKDENIIYNSVHKDISINEDKTMEIKETIVLTFARSGINVGLARNVSHANKITRKVNGKEYVTRTISELSNVSVTYDGKKEYFFVEESGDYFYINTGADYDYKEEGQHTYVIKYTYDMGDDLISEFDDFTFDIMDYGFRSLVESFSASITLPKDFTEGKNISDILTFRTNDMRDVSYTAVNMEINGNTITCSCGKLRPNTGLTMQLILPNGYFNTSFAPNGLYIFLIVLCVLSVVGIAGIVLINHLKRRVIVTPEFYPPKGYNALEVARIYRGKVKSKDFASLIIEWAAKGYVEIKVASKRQILLKKLKDMPKPDFGQTALRKEKDYFDELFKHHDIYDTSDYKNKYNRSLSQAVTELYSGESGKTKKKVLFRLAIEALALLPMLFYLIWYSATLQADVPIFFLFLFPIIAVNVFVYVPMPLWFKIIWCGGFGGGPLAAFISAYQYSYDIYNMFYIAMAIFFLGTASGLFIRVFTKDELKVRGQILGFKQFLVTAEIEKLEMMLAEDPEYYYNILPYCYIFGITKKMEEKFNALHVDPPSYCQGASVVVFYSSISHSMHGMGVSSS
ncbi:MAG: DUF2207 domain-containing protein, partial [Clostridia bacterium]|nr:DUF2207 domain-containing protein [Clostridia bacterium]